MHYRARFVLPIASAPLRDAWVTVADGRIRAVGADRPVPTPGESAVDLGAVALLPGLVNAHTHLELSHLRGEVPRTSEFVTWIRGVLAARRHGEQPGATPVADGIVRGIAECVRSGTAVVGDISNTLAPCALLSDSQLAGVVFYELIRFPAVDGESFVEQAVARIKAETRPGPVRVSLAAHAPYSVGPAVFRAMRRALDRDPSLGPWSVHLAESPAEVEFVRTGNGPWRRLLEELGSWDATWVAPGVSPVEYLDELGCLDRLALVVHGVQMTPVDLARLAARGSTLVTCPRSNAHTGAGIPPVEAFYESGVNVALGTDSLASTPDLSVFAELAALRALAPSVPASRLLDSATRVGAHALGLGADFGTLEPGRRARMLAVQIPAAVDDVEEYLVSGISPDQLTWIE